MRAGAGGRAPPRHGADPAANPARRRLFRAAGPFRQSALAAGAAACAAPCAVRGGRGALGAGHRADRARRAHAPRAGRAAARRERADGPPALAGEDRRGRAVGGRGGAAVARPPALPRHGGLLAVAVRLLRRQAGRGRGYADLHVFHRPARGRVPQTPLPEGGRRLSAAAHASPAHPLAAYRTHLFIGQPCQLPRGACTFATSSTVCTHYFSDITRRKQLRMLNNLQQPAFSAHP